MKLINLKQAPKKKLRETAVSDQMDQPKYPWGLEVNLENESIKKLNIDIENTQAGDQVYFVARADVTTVSRRQNMREGKGKTNDSMSLQITDMYFGKPPMMK